MPDLDTFPGGQSQAVSPVSNEVRTCEHSVAASRTEVEIAPFGARESEEVRSSQAARAVSDLHRISVSSRFFGAHRLFGPPRLSEGDDGFRGVVYINNSDRSNEKYNMAGNAVRTSKYTFLSFIPRNLFEQFHRFAYIYFLFIVILKQIPQLAVFGRTASLFPLALVLIVTAIKNGYEDFGRR